MNLQLPDADPAVPARHPRPVSVSAHPSPAAQTPRRHQRASHTPVSHNAHPDEPPAHVDVYAHPAAVAYAAAHPRRQIPKFGPYLLLQTLGEGEFGKVKLGLHTAWGEEVAVKLIRRGNVDSAVRMSKIEREIEVLRILKHPNIVRLYDVIETDKYIGIILEYASGGELFDHILAHRYLRERDAAKLFSQLISGVWFIHQKKIVHRDLKLENLLLDRNRNVIITDFGFANRFEHRSDDLMQTSCGSPCYAAPELVISEGLYVGSAVDIWSCGVILYAMLAGYLPFDDDPANPDGDNINLLYKYIVSTPLSFPDYISAEARDLLSIMLVPDPSRRASLELVMKHSWLGAYAAPDGGSDVPKAFGRSVDDLERAAMEQHQQKRLAYQKQMRALAAQSAATTSPDPRANRSLSYRPAEPVPSNVATGRSKSSQPAQSEYIYQSSAVDQPIVPATHAMPSHTDTSHRSYGSPSATIGVGDGDPFAGPGGKSTNKGKAPETASSTLLVEPQQSKSHHQKASTSSGEPSSFRHTIQVEYDSPASTSTPQQGRKSEDKERKTGQGQANGMPSRIPQPANRVSGNGPQKQTKEKRAPSTKPLPAPPTSSGALSTPTTSKAQNSPHSPETTPTKRNAAPDTTPHATVKIPIVNVASPPNTPAKVTSRETSDESASQNSISSKKGHKKGVASLDKIGLAKIFGGSHASGEPSPRTPHTERVPSDSSNGASGRAPSTNSSVLLSPSGSEKEKEKEGGRKNRRNTLTVMVEPIISRTMRSKTTKGRTAMTPVTTEVPNTALSNDSATSVKLKVDKEKEKEKPKSAKIPQNNVMDSSFAPELDPGERGAAGLQASTNKARKVMQWFRTKSKGARDSPVPDPLDDEKIQTVATPTIEVASPVQVFVTTPATSIPRTPVKPQRTASTATGSILSTPSLVKRFRNSMTVATGTPAGPGSGSKSGVMQIHRGAVDQTMVTTQPPAEVMKHVREVLEGMGLEIQVETEYMFKCIRAKKKKGVIGGGMGIVAMGQGIMPAGDAGPGGGGGGAGNLAAVTMMGSAASNGVDKRGLPLPSQSTFSATGGMLRGLLMRRQSSQTAPSPVNPNQSVAFDEESSVMVDEPLVISETAYGDTSQDAGDEIRFSVELTRIDRLNDTYSLDLRRLKGTLRSYKYLYDTFRQRANLQR